MTDSKLKPKEQTRMTLRVKKLQFLQKNNGMYDKSFFMMVGWGGGVSIHSVIHA